MTDLRKVAEMALEAMKDTHRFVRHYVVGKETERIATAFEDAMKALRQALAQPEQGEVVVSKNPRGQIVAVTRQDEDGRILKTIATSAQPEQEPVAWQYQEYRSAFMGNLQWFDTVQFVQPPNDPERFRNIKPLYTAPVSTSGYAKKIESLIQERDELRQQLAQPEQEPVAWMYVNEDDECEQIEYGKPFDDPYVTPLYAHPPKREWVGLTDEEIEHLWGITPGDYEDMFAFPRAVEAKLKEKNA